MCVTDLEDSSDDSEALQDNLAGGTLNWTKSSLECRRPALRPCLSKTKSRKGSKVEQLCTPILTEPTHYALFISEIFKDFLLEVDSKSQLMPHLWRPRSLPGGIGANPKQSSGLYMCSTSATAFPLNIFHL